MFLIFWYTYFHKEILHPSNRFLTLCDTWPRTSFFCCGFLLVTIFISPTMTTINHISFLLTVDDHKRKLTPQQSTQLGRPLYFFVESSHVHFQLLCSIFKGGSNSQNLIFSSFFSFFFSFLIKKLPTHHKVQGIIWSIEDGEQEKLTT